MAPKTVPYTVHKNPNPSSNPFYAFLGFFFATIFSLTYLVTTPYIIYSLYTLWTSFRTLDSLLSLRFLSVLPFVISCALPAVHSPWFTENVSKFMLYYFDYSEIRETSDEELLALFESGKSVILAAQPHGVISFTGMCSASFCIPTFRRIKTAAASVVTKVPILKHVMGVFGLIDASKKSLVKHFGRGGVEGSVVIYIGGIAELFKSSRKEERLHLKERKGFIKLALQQGVDVLPLYLLGNTDVLTVVKTGPLKALSRKMGVSVTYFWGWKNLPIPRPSQLVYVRGRLLGMPKIEEPTQDDIDKWHGKYCDEIRRIFNTYKGTCEGYAKKEIFID